jgi:hypothetical protein
MSFATHKKFKHPYQAWEQYEFGRVSNMVHWLPYHPPLVAAIGVRIPSPAPHLHSTPASSPRHPNREPERCIPRHPEDQPCSIDTRTIRRNFSVDMSAGTRSPSAAPTSPLNSTSRPGNQHLSTVPIRQGSPSSTPAAIRQTRASASTPDHQRVSHPVSTTTVPSLQI